MDSTLRDTLYYTTSTVAQTLSGAMGLLGAIVLFALQGNARSIERAAKRLIQVPHESSSKVFLRHLFTRRNYHELARRYAEHGEGAAKTETNLTLLEHHATLTWLLEHDTMLRRSFSRALIASGVVISVSLLSCAFAPQLAVRAEVGHAILIAVTLGAVGCLVLYGLLLRLMLHAVHEERAPVPAAAARP
jgi:hypothetical protein